MAKKIPPPLRGRDNRKKPVAAPPPPHKVVPEPVIEVPPEPKPEKAPKAKPKQGKVSIITRAFNRLEMTIRNIHRVREVTEYPDYEHIIINNGCSDGTREWLDWTKRTKQPAFARLKPVHLDKNYGDWGGMVMAEPHLAPDSEWIVQLDNDMLVSPRWLTYMTWALENTDGRICMCKRTGVGAELRHSRKIVKQHPDGTDLHIGYINRSVACFMMRTSDYRDVIKKVGVSAGRGNKTRIAAMCRPIIKLLNITAHHENEPGKYRHETIWQKY